MVEMRFSWAHCLMGVWLDFSGIWEVPTEGINVPNGEIVQNLHNARPSTLQGTSLRLRRI